MAGSFKVNPGGSAEVVAPSVRQDLTQLISNPNYSSAEFWPVYHNLVAAQLGSIAAESTLRALTAVTSEQQAKVLAGDPVALSQARRGNTLKRRELLGASFAAYAAFGSMNRAKDKAEWMIDNALTQLEVPDIVGDRDEAVKYINDLKIPGRMRNYLRGLSEDTLFSTKRDLIETVASELEDAGIFIFEHAEDGADLVTARNLFVSANETRAKRREIGGARGGVGEMLIKRREFDTEALIIHAEFAINPLRGDELHEQYGQLQVRNVDSFIESLDTIDDSARHFEWFGVLIDNYGVHWQRLYGRHFAHYTFAYQDHPPVAGFRENTRFDIYVSDSPDANRYVSMLQAKMINPQMLGTQKRGRPAAACLLYAKPIDFLFMEIPIPEKVGHIDEKGPTDAQLIKLSHSAKKSMVAVALQLKDYYVRNVPMTKAFNKDVERQVNGGTWVLAA